MNRNHRIISISFRINQNSRKYLQTDTLMQLRVIRQGNSGTIFFLHQCSSPFAFHSHISKMFDYFSDLMQILVRAANQISMQDMDKAKRILFELDKQWQYSVTAFGVDKTLTLNTCIIACNMCIFGSFRSIIYLKNL